jgi:OOP family OmpA-OmpF porin
MMKTIFLAAAALLVLAAPVNAGERAGAASITPFSGVTIFDGSEHLKTGPMLVGIRLGYDITSNWEVDALFNLVSSSITTGISKSDVNVYTGRIEGIYNFRADSRVVPFLAFGGGIKSSSLPFRTSNDATMAYGGGVKLFFVTDAAVRFDARQVYSLHNDTSGGHAINYEFAAGLELLMGSAPPPRVEPLDVVEPFVAPAPVPPPSGSPEEPAEPYEPPPRKVKTLPVAPP